MMCFPHPLFHLLSILVLFQMTNQRRISYRHLLEFYCPKNFFLLVQSLHKQIVLLFTMFLTVLGLVFHLFYLSLYFEILFFEKEFFFALRLEIMRNFISSYCLLRNLDQLNQFIDLKFFFLNSNYHFHQYSAKKQIYLNNLYLHFHYHDFHRLLIFLFFLFFLYSFLQFLKIFIIYIYFIL